MRALKIAVIVMGVLIVGGTIALVIAVARRSAAPVVPVAVSIPASMAAVLDEPDGTRIAGIVAVQDRLALQLQGGGHRPQVHRRSVRRVTQGARHADIVGAVPDGEGDLAGALLHQPRHLSLLQWAHTAAHHRLRPV